MGQYLTSSQAGAAWDAQSMVPAPPGVSLGTIQAAGLLSEMADALGLQPAGVYTPWATRAGDVSWEEIKNPDTNLLLFLLTDPQITAATQITFGQPLPFVAILTREPLTQEIVRQLWNGTAYEPYETQAVYRQDDAKEPPTLFYLHWGSRIDLPDLPRQQLAIAPRANQAGGDLVFAAQVPREGTTTRGEPALPFQMAFEQQVVHAPVVTAGPAPVPAPLPPAPAPAGTNASAPWLLPAAVAVGAGALGYFFWVQRKG